MQQVQENQADKQAVARIHPAAEVGDVTLKVADLTRSLAFYSHTIGLKILHQDAHTAVLGAGRRWTTCRAPGHSQPTRLVCITPPFYFPAGGHWRSRSPSLPPIKSSSVTVIISSARRSTCLILMATGWNCTAIGLVLSGRAKAIKC